MIEITNAARVELDENNENIEGKWIPQGYVYKAIVVDTSDRAELEMAFNANTIEIIEQLDNSEFTHIVKDSLGNLYAVTVADAT